MFLSMSFHHLIWLPINRVGDLWHRAEWTARRVRMRPGKVAIRCSLRRAKFPSGHGVGDSSLRSDFST